MNHKSVKLGVATSDTCPTHLQDLEQRHIFPNSESLRWCKVPKVCRNCHTEKKQIDLRAQVPIRTMHPGENNSCVQRES